MRTPYRSIVTATKDQRVLGSIVEMLCQLVEPPAPAAELNLLGAPTMNSSKRPLVTPKSLRQKAEDTWISILQSSVLGVALRKFLLRIASSKILPWISRPEVLMDFLTDSFNVGGNTSILALSGIFFLIATKNLDYPSFYPKLYSMIDAELFHTKHRSRFLRLLNTSLESPRLPASLIASFIKRLARKSLFAPPAAIVAIVPLLYNLLKMHPTCTFMIHRLSNSHLSSTGQKITTGIETSTISNQQGLDPYNISEPDPQSPNTHSLDSSLWEIESLQCHYQPNVASIAKIISQQFTKQRYNLEDFLDHSYSGMLDSELVERGNFGAEFLRNDEDQKQDSKLTRKNDLRKGKEPIIEYRIPARIFTTATAEESKEATTSMAPNATPDTAMVGGGDGENLVMKLWHFS